MKVWIDQEKCTGDGLCEEIVPVVFTLHDDGLSYVKEDGIIKNDPGGEMGLAVVLPQHESDVADAAKECPGECIYLVPD